jgi:hypothetical protein
MPGSSSLRRIRGIAFAILAAACLAPAVGRAEMLQFDFTALVDATDFGLSESEPLLIRYRYDPLVVPLVVELGTPVVRRIYGPVPGLFAIGGDVVQIEGQLSIDDENSGHDSYNFYAANYVVNTSVYGSVNGTPIHAFSLYFLDQVPPTSMLTSLDPPDSTAFAGGASLVRATFRDFPNQKVVLSDFAPAEFGLFAFVAPEPGASASAWAAAVLTALLARWRRGPSRARADRSDRETCRSDTNGENRPCTATANPRDARARA